MRSYLCAALVAAGSLAAQSALAAENWTTRLPGVTEGLASGALPPAGFYLVNDTLYTPTDLYNDKGDKAGVKLDAFVDVPIGLWVSDFKILGANYGAAIAVPFDHVSTHAGSRSGGTNLGSGAGMYDPLVIPLWLSWKLPYDFHVSANLGVWVPIGTFDKKMAVKNSNNYWAIEPGIGISWLHGGWNASLNLTYDFNFEHKWTDLSGTRINYTSGDQFIAEYSVTHTTGKWSYGIGGYALIQTEKDKIKRNGVTQNNENTRVEKYAIGPIVGYNFGPVIFQGIFHKNILTKNYVGGDEYWTRFTVPF